jgi:hypothetical protein
MAEKPKTTAVATRRTGTAVALPPEWQAELAQAAKDASAKETPSVSSISFRSGVMAYQGQPVPGNTMPCIIVGSAYERALYEGPFDPNNPKNPVCFALTTDGENGKPHENSLKPQNATCAGCPNDEWGSAGEGRRGKACKEIRRLALIPADKLQSAADILNAELASAKVPVTSVGNWSNHVHKVAAVHNMPVWAVVSRISVKPHIKNQFEVFFDIEDTIEDVEALTALKTKVAHVEPFVMTPYSMATEEETKPQQPAKKRKF